MTDAPKIAQRGPYEIQVSEGRSYAWCACGLSKRQPLCDGSHKVTQYAPIVWKAPKTETVWLCGCKQTKSSPFCDGTHNKL